MAVVIAAQVTPEPIAGPAGELILSDAAPTVASDGGATGDVEAPSSPITAMRTTETQLTNSLTNPLAGPWMEPQAGAPTEATAEPPSAAGELVVNLPGEAASQAATEVTGNPVGQSVESMATAEETESAAAALEPNVSSDEQLAATAEADDVPQANAGAASSATTDDEKPRGKTHRAANSAVDGVQAQGNTEPRVPSPEVDSSSTSLDEAATALTPDPTAQLQDRKTEKAALAVKAVATDATGGDLGPQARDSTVTQSATVSQGSGQTASAGEQMDRVRFVQRVARAFESIGGDGGSNRLRLHPPELGSLRLELTLRNGAMNAHLEADTPAARNLLLDNLPALRERLAQQNIKVEQFDVDLADQGTNGSWQQPSDQAHPETGQPGGGARPRKPPESTAENTSAARTAPRYGEGSGFDVTI